MCAKSLLFLGLLISIQSIQCASIENNVSSWRSHRSRVFANNSSLVFKSKNIIRINGTRFSELNCNSHNSQTRKACSNITEMTCQKELGQIKSSVIIQISLQQRFDLLQLCCQPDCDLQIDGFQPTVISSSHQILK